MRWSCYLVLSLLIGWWLGGLLPGHDSQSDVRERSVAQSLLTDGRAAGAMTQAIRRVLEINDPYERVREVQRLANGASTIELRALAAACREDRLAIKGLVDVWARYDPQACMEAIWEHKHMTKSLFQWWALQDPDAAMKGATEIGREIYQQVVGVALLETDPERAVQILGEVSIRSYEDLPDAERVQLTPENVAVLRERIDRIKGQSRYRLKQRVGEFLFERDPEDGLHWLHARGGDTRELLGAYYLENPVAAKRFVEAEGNDPEMRAHLAQAMAKEDPEAALAYAESCPGRTDTAIQGVMYEWAKTDPSAVAQQMDKVSHYYREDVWHEVLEHWFKASPEEAADHVRGIPFEDAEGDWDSLSKNWREADLDGLASYVASLPGDYPTEMMTEAVAEKFVMEERLDDGVAWFGRLDAAHQGKALGYLLEPMLPVDVEGAEALARQSQHALVAFGDPPLHRGFEIAIRIHLRKPH